MANDRTDSTAAASRGPKKAPPPPLPTPLSYSVAGAIAASGLGRSTIFQLMADGRLNRVKVGKRTLIPRASLEALISGEVA